MFFDKIRCPGGVGFFFSKILDKNVKIPTSRDNVDRCIRLSTASNNRARGRGVLPSKRLLGMCRWMGSHFYNWTEYNGVTFLVELLEWGRKFSGFLE